MRSFLLLAAAALITPGAAATAAAPRARNGSLAYVDSHGIARIRKPGGRTILVSEFARGPAWSRDGRFLGYASGGSGSAIVLARSNGDPLRRITRRHDDEEPTWSPDGKRVAFVRSFPLSPKTGADSIRDLFVVRADGTRLRRLTRDRAQNTSPAWSPGGRRIAFTRSGNLAVLDLRGMIERPLVRKADHAAWSPDGRRLAFDRVVDPYRDMHAVFVVPARGGSARRVSPRGFDAVAPAWSPDGRFLAVSGVFVLRADGRGRPRFVSSGFDPAWQPLPRRR